MHTKYEKKDEWWRRGKNILIQVKRSDVTPYAVEDGGQRWCIYAFIYPGHPYFTEFAAEDGNMMQPAAAAMPCHSYASFFRVHSEHQSGKVVSYQVGWDFNHLHDERFTHFTSPGEASEVFSCADSLYDWLCRFEKTTSQKD